MTGNHGDAGPLEILLVARHPYGGRPPLGDWQMARALAKQHRVLYVDPPLILKPGGGRPSERGPGLERSKDGVMVLRPVAPPGAARPRTAWISDRMLERQMLRACRAAFENPPVIICFDPLRGTLPRVPRALFVYWRRDRLADLSVSRRAEWLAARDRQLLATSDLVSCTASTLVDEARRYARGKVEYLANGCDAAHFSEPRDRPAMFPDASVVLGFVGGAFWRLDGQLIDELARLRPDWTLLFVGDDATALSDRPNVIQVGYVPYDEIPAWIQHLDVGLIPYDLDIAFNHGSFPIKAYEYLAAGLPVVSTPMPALVEMAPLIRFASGAESFVLEIDCILSNPRDAETNQAAAIANSWDVRATSIAGSIRKVMS